MTSICVNCCKAEQLKNLIIVKGALIDKCDICGSSNVEAMDCEDNGLIQLFKSLIRYNYSEWDYNTHWGGDGLEALFIKENQILNWDPSFDEEKLNDAILIFISEVYEEYDKGVTLFAGYDENGQQNMLLKALARDFDYRLSRLSNQLAGKNYFLLEGEGVALLKKHVGDLEAFVKADTEYYRARIGYAKEATPLFGFGEEYHYKPYGDSQIGAPPPLKTNSGRMNRVGVSFLYLASDENTAIAEVRPYPGQIVSTGKFICKDKVRVADFSSIDISQYSTSDKLLDDFLLLKSIEKLFSQPIPPEKNHKYFLTQFLSDIVRKLDFNGVAFKSSLGKGTNLTIFNPEQFYHVSSSENAIKVEGLEYSHSNLSLMEDDGEYA